MVHIPAGFSACRVFCWINIISIKKLIKKTHIIEYNCGYYRTFDNKDNNIFKQAGFYEIKAR